MATFLKRATRTPTTGEDRVQAAVREILDAIEAGGEAEALSYAQRFDGWTGPALVPEAAFEAAEAALDPQLKRDIQFAHARVKAFAEAQKASLQEFEVELQPGLLTGQRLVPLTTAGCYVPGGRYAHVASAIMSVTTARVAGVEQVIVASPPRGGQGVHPAVLYAARLAGADAVLCLGGVQGIAALAYGLFTGHAADILVGPGNAYVAEAKRMLFGRCGIDLYAGPTEILVLADESADPELVAVDLVGQAEHGPDSPAILVSTDRALCEAVMARMPALIAALPADSAAEAAWRDCGEVVLCESREEAAAESDRYAPEHLEVHAQDLEWWLERLRNYGSLFLGEQTTVAYGDKASGPNHILPTKGAARYTGGLSVHKFIKKLTWQRMTDEAVQPLGPVTARISRLEGMEAHARTADIRVQRYGGEA
ncbi:MAG: histidinol dehydrogenase [Alphaproteobacteria bacterium]|nr:histidinol dehydrogenase [Alphaproteobacteria bacterium]